MPDQIVGWSGECRDGRASGPGVLSFFRLGELVERNDGQFVDGKLTGQGARENRKARYVGNFKDGLFDGEGVYVSFDGMRYEGEWKNGNLDGRGKLSFASGLRYEGQFRANSYNGSGRMTLPDGARYDGEYELNTPHGTGVYTTADGTTFAGRWVHGCFRQDGRTAHLSVPAEDCGLSEEPSTAVAAAPDRRDSREN